jgi:hypothetical protein
VFGALGVAVVPVVDVDDDPDVDDFDPVPPEELAVAQVGPVMELASSVTVPAESANTLPFKVAPVSSAVTPFWAIIVPINEVVVPKVAELPILHHTLHGSPPVTEEPDDVISVETVLKIQTPDPVSFKFPLSVKLLVEQ